MPNDLSYRPKTGEAERTCCLPHLVPDDLLTTPADWHDAQQLDRCDRHT